MAASYRTFNMTRDTMTMFSSTRVAESAARMALGTAIVVTAMLSISPAKAQDASPPTVQPAIEDSASAPGPISQPSDNPAPSAFLQGSAALPSAEIETWLANPTLSFAGNLSGSIVNYIVRLSGSDSRAVLALIQLAEADETPLRINQISRGLARSRNNASGVAIEYASFMDERVASSSSQRLIEAYQAALQEGTAAINAGAVGAGPDGGSLSGDTNVGGGSGDGGVGGTVATRGFDTVLSASYSGIFTSDASPAN